MTERRHQRILLIGMMGAGKSSVGRLLAGRLGWPYLDSDERVLQRTGKTVPQIFAERGETAFRAEEAQALQEAVTGGGPLVVSVAGGAILSVDNRKLLKGAGLVVWLRAELTTLASRVGRGNGRPLLGNDPMTALTRLYAERRTLYQQLADVTIDVDHLKPGDVADRIVAAHRARQAAARA